MFAIFQRLSSLVFMYFFIYQSFLINSWLHYFMYQPVPYSNPLTSLFNIRFVNSFEEFSRVLNSFHSKVLNLKFFNSSLSVFILSMSFLFISISFFVQFFRHFSHFKVSFSLPLPLTSFFIFSFVSFFHFFINLKLLFLSVTYSNSAFQNRLIP